MSRTKRCWRRIPGTWGLVEYTLILFCQRSAPYIIPWPSRSADITARFQENVSLLNTLSVLSKGFASSRSVTVTAESALHFAFPWLLASAILTAYLNFARGLLKKSRNSGQNITFKIFLSALLAKRGRRRIFVASASIYLRQTWCASANFTFILHQNHRLLLDFRLYDHRGNPFTTEYPFTVSFKSSICAFSAAFSSCKQRISSFNSLISDSHIILSSPLQ